MYIDEYLVSNVENEEITMKERIFSNSIVPDGW
jgi:hypothetical protein